MRARTARYSLKSGKAFLQMELEVGDNFFCRRPQLKGAPENIMSKLSKSIQRLSPTQQRVRLARETRPRPHHATLVHSDRREPLRQRAERREWQHELRDIKEQI